MFKFFFKNFIWHLKNFRFFNNFLFYYYYYIISFVFRFFSKKFKSSDSWCEKNISKKIIIKKKFLDNRPFKKIKIKKIKKSAANIDLLFSIINNNKNIKKILETGVSYGYSSYVILDSIKHRKKSFLYSIDMPYVEKKNFEYVGSVVPKNLRKKWHLLRCPDRNGIAKISKMRIKFDLIHYDSDKTFYGRYVSYFKIYELLKKGGIFISDDVGDNHAFKYFVNKKKVKFYIVKVNNKYQGLFKK